MSLYKWLFGVDKPKVTPVVYPIVEPQCNYPADLSPAEKADRILEHRKMVEKCWEADICPVCGEALTLRILGCSSEYHLDMYMDSQVYCSKNPSHFCRYIID